MENIAMLKQMVCLLSCQPRNMGTQLPEALKCLQASINAKAVGIYWPNASGKLVPRIQNPRRYRVEQAIREAINGTEDPVHPVWGQTKHSWLVVPMKVGGKVVGRLWIIDKAEREFGQDDREFIMMTGNQLALALENNRLFDEVQHLAARRGELLRRVIATQDERCRQISRELHDEISQSLTAMAVDIEAIQVADRWSQDAALKRLGELRGRSISALEEVNRIILDLRPTLLEDMGLLTALRWFADQRLESLGVRIHVRSSHPEVRLPPHIETTLYRVGQEAINNTAKHAAAKNLWIGLAHTKDNISLSIRDDGIGFEVKNVLSHPDDRVGIGLFGMRERAALVGGTTIINSKTGDGTHILVRMPKDLEVNYGTDTGLAG